MKKATLYTIGFRILCLAGIMILVGGCGCRDVPDRNAGGADDLDAAEAARIGSSRVEVPSDDGKVRRRGVSDVAEMEGSTDLSSITVSELEERKRKADELLAYKPDLSDARVVAVRNRPFFEIPVGERIDEKMNPPGTYSRLYYMDSVVRYAELCIQGNCNASHYIYYDDHGNPLLVAEIRGHRYIGSWFEYDRSGYLQRIVKWDINGNLSSVTVFAPEKGYAIVSAQEYVPVDGQLTLWNRYRYGPDGTRSSNARDDWTERRVNDRSFLDHVIMPEQAGLRSLLVIPGREMR